MYPSAAPSGADIVMVPIEPLPVTGPLDVIGAKACGPKTNARRGPTVDGPRSGGASGVPRAPSAAPSGAVSVIVPIEPDAMPARPSGASAGTKRLRGPTDDGPANGRGDAVASSPSAAPSGAVSVIVPIEPEPVTGPLVPMSANACGRAWKILRGPWLSGAYDGGSRVVPSAPRAAPLGAVRVIVGIGPLPVTGPLVLIAANDCGPGLN
jgi:hypothetical protein